MSDAREQPGTVLMPCPRCGVRAGDEHRPECAEHPARRARRSEGICVHVDGCVCVLRSEHDAVHGWRGEWEFDGRSSRELPLGGLEECRYPTSEMALAQALINVMPLIRASRGRPA